MVIVNSELSNWKHNLETIFLIWKHASFIYLYCASKSFLIKIVVFKLMDVSKWTITLFYRQQIIQTKNDNMSFQKRKLKTLSISNKISIFEIFNRDSNRKARFGNREVGSEM